MTGPNEYGVYAPSKDDWRPLPIELPGGCVPEVALVQDEAGWHYGLRGWYEARPGVPWGLGYWPAAWKPAYETREAAIAAALAEVRGLLQEAGVVEVTPWQPRHHRAVPAGGVQLGLFEGVG